MEDFETLAGCVVAVVFGVGFIYAFLRDQEKLAKVKYWPTTGGEIICQHYNHSKIDALRNRAPEQVSHSFATLSTEHKKLWLQYEYTVDGKKYINETYSIGGSGATVDELMKAQRKYSLGAKVSVYYDSKDPEDSLLTIRSGSSQGTLICGVALLCFGLFAFPVILLADYL